MATGIPKNFGKFTLLRELGRGGMGVVFLARDNDLGREVALKMLLSTDSSSLEMERFRRESRAAAKLKHPNIVPIYETGTEAGRAFFTMEFVKGHSLERRMPELDMRKRLEIVRDVARALEYAHGQGIVHRDIKPSNVVLSEDGRPVLMDFGLAKHLEDGRNLTQSGTIMGTPNFMSPEQASGDPDSIDGRSDVFSLGGVMYYLLTDRPPFEKADTVKTVLAVLAEPPVPPRQRNPAVPRDVETICLKALAKAPVRRYQSAEDFAADIDRHLAGSAIVARPPGTTERAAAWVRRHTALTAAGIVALLGLAAVGIVWGAGRSDRAERERQLAAEGEKRKLEAAAAARRAAAAEWVRPGREQLDIAEKCLMTGRADDLRAALARAIEAFGKALAADDACAEAHAGRGRALRLRGERTAAIADLALAGDSAEAAYELGLARLDQFLDAKTAALAEPFAAGEPSATARMARALQLAAAEDLSRAATAKPPAGREWMPIHARAGLAFLALKLPDALSDLGTVIGQNPFRDDALALRGYIRLATPPPDVPGALDDLNRAVQANSLSASHRNLRGVAKARSGDPKGALEDFDAALGLDPSFAPARLNRSSSRLAAGDAAGAAADADVLVASSKDNLLALQARAEARIALRDLPGAEADLSGALALSPGALSLTLRRATVRRLSGKLDDALADARTALASGDVDVRVRASLEVAEILCARPETPAWQEVLAQVETALAAKQEPRPDDLYHLAVLFEERGEKKLAVSHYELFLKCFPGHAKAPAARAALEALKK